MAHQPWFERVYRILLRLLPREFRGDFGEAMTEDFRDQVADAGQRRGRQPRFRLWWQTVAGIVRLAPAEHVAILRRDAAYAVRMLRGRPAFAATAILTLTVGIGVTTAVFSVAHGILLRRLPLPESERLLRLSEVTPAPESRKTAVSGENFLDWRAQTRTLDRLALIGAASATLTGAGTPIGITGMSVSEDFFPMIGVTPLHGRLFVDDDYRAWRAARTGGDSWPGPTVMILSEELWRRHFHANPAAVGTVVRLRGDPVEIVGVLAGPVYPRSYFGTEAVEYWIPGGAPSGLRRRARNFGAVGRLAPGATLLDARAELAVITASLAAAHPDANEGWGLHVVPLQEDTAAPIRRQLWLLVGATLCVLLIACANVANLVLAHAAGRRHELATRVALGASRSTLVRQALTEGLVLGVCGGTAGGMLAMGLFPMLVGLAPPETPRLHELAIDGRLLAFALGCALVSGVAAGLAGSFVVDRMNPKTSFRHSGVDGARSGGTLRSVMTAAQVALAVVLVVAAGLLVQSMRAASQLDLGFNPDRVLALGLAPDFRKYGGIEGVNRFNATVLERLGTHPRIVAAGVGSRPLSGGGGASNVVSTPGGPADGVRMAVDTVSPGYFAVLGLTAEAGRLLGEADGPGTAPVAVVNRRAAIELGIADSPVGAMVSIDGRARQVVGVVRDTRRGALEADPAPATYLSYLQLTNSTMGQLLIKAEGDARDIVPDVRRIVADLDPDLALTRIQTLDERRDEFLEPRRFLARLVGLFSLLALGLAMIGVYGVIADAVAQRVPEIGVRMALGATGADILRLVLTRSLAVIGVGVLAGIGGAVALRDSMEALLFGVPASDPLSYALAAACLLAASVGASLIPARRASRVDPVIALRQD